MRVALLLCLSLTAVLAGCSGPEPATSTAPADLPAAAPEAPLEELVYSHDALVAGAGVPNPVAPLGTPWPVPPTKVDSFDLAAEALDLAFEAEVCFGTGLAGFEVAGPDGAVVWASEINKRADTPVVGCVDLPAVHGTEGPFPPGRYEVRVLVAGAMQPTLKVLGHFGPGRLA